MSNQIIISDTQKYWSSFAKHAGLSMRQSKGLPRVSGLYKGRIVALILLKEKTIGLSTVLTVKVNKPVTHRFTINSPTGFGKLRKLLGLNVPQLGRESFDRRFDVKSTPQEYLSMLLDNEIQLQSLFDQLYAKDFTLILGPTTLSFYCQRKYVYDLKILDHLLDSLCAIAEKIERHPQHLQSFD